MLVRLTPLLWALGVPAEQIAQQEEVLVLILYLAQTLLLEVVAVAHLIQIKTE
jgi:hypothetical protein